MSVLRRLVFTAISFGLGCTPPTDGEEASTGSGEDAQRGSTSAGGEGTVDPQADGGTTGGSDSPGSTTGASPPEDESGASSSGAGVTDPPSSGWTVVADFEDGEPGARANGADGFGEAFARTVYTQENVHGGTQAAEVGIEAGSDGWGQWGGIIAFPDLATEGDDIWFQISALYPDGFDFSTDSGALKFMRVHTRAAGGGSGSNEGYFDVLISGDLSVGSELGTGHFENNPGWADNGVPVPTGVWQTYEIHLHLASAPGEGIFRVWQNHQLVFEDTQTATLRTETSESDAVYVYTYWNGNAPATQVAYVDDIIITTATPDRQDDAGNPYIGPR